MCPYESWSPATFVFCEFQRCEWVKEPVNTYSNIGFLIVGLGLWGRYHRVPQVRVIAVGSVLVGILSAFYHATSSYVGEVLDLGSIYLILGGLVAFNLQRLGLLSVKTSERFAVAVSVLGMAILFRWRGIGETIFNVLLFLALLLELKIYLQARKPGLTCRYRFFWLALACHLTAFGLWWLDSEKILCSPQSLFQGHAVWHLLGAGTFYGLSRFYLQFWIHSETFTKRVNCLPPAAIGP